MAFAVPPVGVTASRQPLGVMRSLTDEFIRSRVSTRPVNNQSDSEDVRWVRAREDVVGPRTVVCVLNLSSSYESSGLVLTRWPWSQDAAMTGSCLR